MTKIVPIRGVRYNTDLAGKMADLITPPYDVINMQEQRAYYDKSPYNVIRLEYGEIRSQDDQQDNRYTRAAGFFHKWLHEDILRHENNSAIYLYEQEFTVADQRMTRNGFMAGVGVEEYETGMILPHEETLFKAKADRLEILRHCQANFSPIFSLYDDPSLTIETMAQRYKQDKPTLSFTDDFGETHRFWVVTDKNELAELTDFFQDQKIYIADGHHRYETALTFHKERVAQGDNSCGFCLMTLVNLYDPGLVIFPTHRMIKNVTDFDAATFLAQLEHYFSVTPLPLSVTNRADAIAGEISHLTDHINEQNAFLLYLTNNQLYRLTKDRNAQDPQLAKFYGANCEAWRTLDVSVLQGLILEGILGIDKEARANGTNLTYTRDEAGALDKVDAGEYQAIIFLNPTRVQEVTAVAAAGDKMPQKSTYFYPKLVTGLVINDFTT